MGNGRRRSIVRLVLLLLLLGLAVVLQRKARDPSLNNAGNTTQSKSTGPTVTAIQDDSGVIATKHFFDCNHKDSVCKFLNPHDFFQNGLGRRFYKDYQRLGGFNNNLPALTNLEWTCKDGDSLVREYYSSHYPRNFTFVHMHKCGGTTVKAAMYELRDAMKETGSIEASITSHKYSFGGGSKKSKEQHNQARQQHVEYIAKTQEKAKFPVFTVFRDPVQRFLSAVQQVMHYNEDFRKKCLQSTATSTIQCAIDDMAQTGYRHDVHLLPMATHLRVLDLYDLNVSVFHMQDSFDALLTYFGTNAIHTHDRTRVEYATSKVLAEMTVDKDCTKDMIEEICSLYAVDVAMMRSLGFPTPYCQEEFP